LQISYEHIRDCECRLEGKDGCYHCILSYGNQWQRKNLSRERAEDLFKRIVDECDNWEDIEGSVGTITTSGVIEDSELEILFTKAMEKIATEKGWTWERKTDAINETYNYILEIREEGLNIKYNIYPQYRLGPAQGVALITKPDFQFICLHAEIDGEEIPQDSLTQWSVYLDGYQYHASKENMGFYNDVERREAISNSQTGILRRTWTLTWEDLQPFFADDQTPTRMNSLNLFVGMLTDAEIEVQKDSAFGIVNYYNWSAEEQKNWRLPAGLTEIDKDVWKAFWYKYNILQILKQGDNTPIADDNDIDLDEILIYFPGLEDIVTALVNNHIPFDEDGGYDLKEDGVIIASAAIKIKNENIVIDEFDDETKSIFESHGFKAYTPATFNINEFKR